MNPEDVTLPPHQSISISVGALSGRHDLPQPPRASSPAAVVTEASSLSVKYRKLMRWYPAAWRAAHEDVMLGILLEQADNEHRSDPTPSERSSLFWAGMAQRFGLPRRGERLRLAPLSVAAALSIFYATFIIWAPASNYVGSVGPFSNPSIVTCILFVLALFTALLIRGRTASTLVLIAVGVEIAIGVLSSVNQWQGPSWTAVTLFAGLGVLSGSSFRQGWSLVIGTLLVTTIAAGTIIVSWVMAGLGQFSTVSLIATIVTVLVFSLASALLVRKIRRLKA